MSLELQNCFFEAQMARAKAQAEENDAIAEECQKGFWVVTVTSLWHCRVSDAVVGDFTQAVCSKERQEEAEELAKQLNDGRGMDWDEISYGVVGPEYMGQ